ncbi:DUF4349 domain-containing protein [Promineifilum sp.]|uniref:DUF4349 domain-containing protein n=1 Tax=Promineifilum sp. TaxID=2664178 RepID=UPI0035B395D0
MKRRNVVLVVLVLVAAGLLAACGGSAQMVEVTRLSSEVVAEGDMAGAAAPEMAALPEEAAMEAPMADTAAQVAPGQERLIIRTADMAIVATDTEVALARIAEMANSSGGWVVGSNVYQSTETAKTGYIQIRVPSEGFQSVLDAIAGLAVEVSSLSTSGQDVTEEYVDLSSQLTNLEATAARVRTFLDDATRVQDALAVNSELSRLEGEIAVIKGRMQYLDQSASFSSITVNVTPDELTQPIEVAGWQPQGAAKRAVEALINALQTLADLIIWFAIFVLPVLALILLPFLLIIWLIRRLRRRERVETTTPPPPAEK